MTYPVDRCPSCGGKRVWLSREFNPYPRWTYRHEKGCPASRYFSQPEQDKVAAAFGSCPVHGLEPELECRGCAELADADRWTPESERL